MVKHTLVNETERKLILGTAQILGIFRDAALIAYEKQQPPPDIFLIAEEIVHKCFSSQQIMTQLPMLKSALGESAKEVFSEIDKLRGYRPPKRNAEAASILRMLKKKFTPEQIIEAWKTLKQDKFWQDKELFLMTVESQIGAMTNRNNITPKSDPDKFIHGKYGHMVKR